MKRTIAYSILCVLFFLAAILATLLPPSAILFGYLRWSADLPIYLGGLHPWVSGPATALVQCGQPDAANQLLATYGHASLSSLSIFALFLVAVIGKWKGRLFGRDSISLENLYRIGLVVFELIIVGALIFHFDLTRVRTESACDVLATGGFFSLLRPNITEPVILSFAAFSMLRQISVVAMVPKRKLSI